jgi:hypothetical protein
MARTRPPPQPREIVRDVEHPLPHRHVERARRSVRDPQRRFHPPSWRSSPAGPSRPTPHAGRAALRIRGRRSARRWAQGPRGSWHAIASAIWSPRRMMALWLNFGSFSACEIRVPRSARKRRSGSARRSVCSNLYRRLAAARRVSLIASATAPALAATLRTRASLRRTSTTSSSSVRRRAATFPGRVCHQQPRPARAV